MASIAKLRLADERKKWRKEKPLGFHASPETFDDGSTNLMKWKCHIPGKQGTEWEGGSYPLVMVFSEEYPIKPPHCTFPSKFFHPNVYSDGSICLSILNEDDGWRPSIEVKQILLGIQELLTDPNPKSAANLEASNLFEKNRGKYVQRVKQQAKLHPSLL